MNSKLRLIVASILSIVLVAMLLIGSTYSIFTTTEVDEDANVYKTGNLKVTYGLDWRNIQFTNVTPMTEEEADSLSPYRITVRNTGNVPYMFDVILNDFTSSVDNTIDYQYIMTKVGYLEPKKLSNCTNNVIKEDIIILPNESVAIDIRIWISDAIKNSEIGKSFYAKLSIDGLAIYDDNTEINNDMLSLRYMKNTGGFQDGTYKPYIKSASFVNYIDISNAITNEETNEKATWDMILSDKSNGTNAGKVIAWLEDNGTTDDSGNKYYDLYIGSSEKIYVKSLDILFSGMSSLESISFDNLDTSLTTRMYSMFNGCNSLVSLDLSNFDTSNVTDMAGVFYNCRSLTSLDLSDWDVSNVTYLNTMFRYCNALEILNLSGWNTGKVTNMAYMFEGCKSLINLDLSSFDTSSVTAMESMFLTCNSLVSLNLSGWNTGNVKTMGRIFFGCQNLTELDVNHFDTSSVTSMIDMFRNCYNLTELDLSGWNTSSVMSMEGMFFGCQNLTELDVSHFNTSKVTNMGGMFNQCSSLTKLDVSHFNTSKVTNMGSMFRMCLSLTNLDLSGWDVSNVTDMSNMFSGSWGTYMSLTKLILGEWNTSSVTNMGTMFGWCSNLTTSIIVRNTSITYSGMFTDAATAEGAQITVNYVGDDTITTDVNESTEALVEAMVATKSSNSNVVKGSLVT